MNAARLPYPRRRRRGLLWDAVFVVALALVLCWIAPRAREALPQTWEWGRIASYIVWHDAAGWHPGLLVRGLGATLRLGVWSCLLALLVGAAAGVRTARGKGPDVPLVHALVTLLRNTPPLVLLFLVYFFAAQQLFPGLEAALRAAPPAVQQVIGVLFAEPAQADRMLAAVLTLGLYEGAYVAEIVRAGLQSVPGAQWDAGAALGFSRWQRLRLIVAPQSLPLVLPPLAGQCVSAFKDSALASLISVPDLTFQGMEVMAVTRLPFETWVVVGLFYLVISLTCVAAFRFLERKIRWRAY